VAVLKKRGIITESIVIHSITKLLRNTAHGMGLRDVAITIVNKIILVMVAVV